MVPHPFALITVACGPSRQVLYLCNIILLHSSLWPVALLVFCVLQVEFLAVSSIPAINNYHTWKFDMQALLMLMRNAAWLIVNGTMEEPSNRSTQEWKDWQLANMNAAGVIYSQVESQIQPLIRENLDSAFDTWSTLEEHYSKDNAASRFLVYDKFFSISKSEDEFLTSLVGRVKDTLQKLCSSRSDSHTIEDFESQLAAMVLIRSLPEEFASFKSSLLLLDSAISLQSVKTCFCKKSEPGSLGHLRWQWLH